MEVDEEEEVNESIVVIQSRVFNDEKLPSSKDVLSRISMMTTSRWKQKWNIGTFYSYHHARVASTVEKNFYTNIDWERRCIEDEETTSEVS